MLSRWLGACPCALAGKLSGVAVERVKYFAPFGALLSITLFSPHFEVHFPSLPTGSPLVPGSLQNDAASNTAPAVFQFEICNTVMVPVTVAVMGRPVDHESEWIIKGWKTVPANTCELGGKFLRGKFFVAATAPGRHWGKGSELCVSVNTFHWIARNHYCGENDHLIAFSEYVVDATHWTWYVRE